MFNTAKTIEAQMEQFFDCISEAGMIFKIAIGDYLQGDLEPFRERIGDIKKQEGQADNLRREIRYLLYKKMLIPESRGDVLGLLENSDDVIDATKKVLLNFDIETPIIPGIFHSEILKLTDVVVDAVSNLVKANRAFIKNNDLIDDYIHKVHFYEHEADKIEERLKKSIFQSPEVPELSARIQLRDFITSISSLADESEDVVERLSVYAIKRSI